jgi:hypothetical protein
MSMAMSSWCKALQGTHDGPLQLPFGELPATGKQMDAPCCMPYAHFEPRRCSHGLDFFACKSGT